VLSHEGARINSYPFCSNSIIFSIKHIIINLNYRVLNKFNPSCALQDEWRICTALLHKSYELTLRRDGETKINLLNLNFSKTVPNSNNYYCAFWKKFIFQNLPF
jgi:hypothetical protein